MLTRRKLLLAAVLMALATVYISAEEINIPVTDYAVISHGNTEFRILARFEIPEGVADSTLMFVELGFGIAPVLEQDSVLRIDCNAITFDWNMRSADWNYPWQNPGGDFDEDLMTMFTVTSANRGRAYFDLTDIVRSWLRNEANNHGLIFLIPNGISSSFEVQRLPGLPEDAIAEVKFVTK
jgi:hypothetical protein